MLHPIISTRKLTSHVLFKEAEMFGGFVEKCTYHSFSTQRPDITVISCQFEPEKFSSCCYLNLFFDEPDNIKKAVTKRRAEYLAGRLAAVFALEEIMPPSVAKSIAPNILTEQDWKLFYSTGLNFSLFCTIAFSAKESLFKAVYPYMEKYLEFDVAELVEVCIVTKRFKLRVAKMLVDELIKESRLFHGYFEINKNSVETIVIESK